MTAEQQVADLVSGQPQPAGLVLRDLPPGDPGWHTAFAVLQQLRGHLDRDGFDRLHRVAVPQGLRFTGAFLPPGSPAADGPQDRVAGTGHRAEADRTGDAERATGIGQPASPTPRCVGVAGWRVVDTTSVLRKLYVDDLVVDADARSGGVGSVLLEHLVGRARSLGCHTLELDSGHQRVDAHRFYLREGFTDASRHFVVRLDVGG